MIQLAEELLEEAGLAPENFLGPFLCLGLIYEILGLGFCGHYKYYPTCIVNFLSHSNENTWMGDATWSLLVNWLNKSLKFFPLFIIC